MTSLTPTVDFPHVNEGDDITLEEFKAYEKVRSGGKTNMYDVNMVCRLSKHVLSQDTCIKIMKNYSYLNEKYPGVRK